jgi:hypothetical protein
LYNGDSDYLHITQAEGLPNITGGFVSATAQDRKISDKAFEKEDYSSSSYLIGTSGNAVPHEKYKINAAIGEVKSDGTYKNDVYGKSDHVTTYNSAIQIWRRIRSTTPP